jgi:hypothetical protein
MIYEINKWLFSHPELCELYNEHYGYVSGDEGYWESWDDSPVFPWNEQPESDKFYVVWSTKERRTMGHFWETKVYFDFMVYSNNIKLLNDSVKKMIYIAGRHEESVRPFQAWLAQSGISDMSLSVEDMHFESSTDIVTQEQENGVYGKAMRFCVLAHDC